MEIFDAFMDPGGPLDQLARYGHVLSGVTWIGLLYFFNFVQVPAYAALSDTARSEALRNLTWRALWWFRYAALATFLFGILIISVYMGEIEVPGGEAISKSEILFSGQRGVSILTGILLATTMFLNVWGVIWRNQKIVIGSARTVADGGTADPNAPASAKKAARASRCNVFFSIAMLFFMVFAPHGSWFASGATGGTIVYWVLVLAIWAVVEASALGFVGGIDGPINKALFDDHKKTIIGGFVLLAVLYFLGWEILLAP